MSKKKKESDFPYLHGFSGEEQARLRRQAEMAEYMVFQDINFSQMKNVLEVGCGVGAQSEILLRRFPKLNLTSIDQNDRQLESAANYLKSCSYAKDRYELKKMDAMKLDFESNSFDGAFLCWVLEHVPKPIQVLSEVRRVVKPGGLVVITEVMNSTFFLDPYSPNVWKFWMAYNDYQYDLGGDPFVGAKLGNFLVGLGYRHIQMRLKSWHLDNREPEQRKEMIEHWSDLLLSGAEGLIKAGYVDEKLVKKARKELQDVASNPNAVFHDTFMQAQAKVY